MNEERQSKIFSQFDRVFRNQVVGFLSAKGEISCGIFDDINVILSTIKLASVNKEGELINSIINESRFAIIEQFYELFQNSNKEIILDEDNYNTQESNHSSLKYTEESGQRNKKILINKAIEALGHIVELIPEESLNDDLHFMKALLAAPQKELERKLRDSQKIVDTNRDELKKLKAEIAEFKKQEKFRKIDEQALSIVKKLEDPEADLKAENFKELEALFANDEMGLNADRAKEIFMFLGYAEHYYEFIFTYFKCSADIFKRVNYNIDIGKYDVTSEHLPLIKGILTGKINRSRNLYTFINNLPIESEELKDEVLIFVDLFIKCTHNPSKRMQQDMKNSVANLIQKMADDYIAKKRESEKIEEQRLKIRNSDNRTDRVRNKYSSKI
jgi:hypothetical protein